jgi:hypothetical protein
MVNPTNHISYSRILTNFQFKRKTLKHPNLTSPFKLADPCGAKTRLKTGVCDFPLHNDRFGRQQHKKLADF